MPRLAICNFKITYTYSGAGGPTQVDFDSFNGTPVGYTYWYTAANPSSPRTYANGVPQYQFFGNGTWLYTALNNEGRHDLPEGDTQDDTDGHIEYVALDRKFLELSQHIRTSTCEHWGRTLHGRHEVARRRRIKFVHAVAVTDLGAESRYFADEKAPPTTSSGNLKRTIPGTRNRNPGTRETPMEQTEPSYSSKTPIKT